MALVAMDIDTRLPSMVRNTCHQCHVLGGVGWTITFDGMEWYWAALVIAARHSSIATPSMLPLPSCPIWWHAIGRQCMPPQCYGRLIHVAWHSAAVDIGSRHSPIAAPSMPPLPCCPIQWYVIGRQCMPPQCHGWPIHATHILQIQCRFAPYSCRPRPSAS